MTAMISNITQLVLATHNLGKIREISAYLTSRIPHITSAHALGLPEPEETGVTFSENARLKAFAIFQQTNLPALADDSGLVIPAINNQPGVHSARWAEVTPGGKRDFNKAIQRITDALQGETYTPAHMICAMCLAYAPDAAINIEGKVMGHVVLPPRGENGLGYDPIFIPEGYTQTYAEMSSACKFESSHRAAALKQLMHYGM